MVEALLGFLIGDIILGTVFVVAEFVLEVTRSLNQDKRATPIAIIAFVVLGLLIGGLSASIISWRVVPSGESVGISLIVTPILFAGLAHLGGRRRARHHQVSHLATWYGGAAVGLGLAAGRLGALRMLGQV